MEPIQTSPQEDNPVLIETTQATKPTFWHRYHWHLVIFVIVALLIGGGLALCLTKDRGQAASTTPSVHTSAKRVNSSTSQVADTSTNHWKGSVDPAALPLGDGHVSTTAKAGYVDSCTTSFRGGGARHAGSWINETNGTWNSQAKVNVEGSINWPSASYAETTSGTSRILTTNDLPETYPTGIFPISRTDPAYQYDTNPNSIRSQSLSYQLPLNPVASATPGCLPLGPIGIFSDGVVLFNALDDGGRDAVAHETQDVCSGHPNGQEMYHYHNVPSCLRDKATGTSTLVGYAFDGYGIYVERDSTGNLPTNADLDACHGRISEVMWNGKLTSEYHYDATLEYPYTVGCYEGTPAATRRPQQ